MHLHVAYVLDTLGLVLGLWDLNSIHKIGQRLSSFCRDDSDRLLQRRMAGRFYHQNVIADRDSLEPVSTILVSRRGRPNLHHVTVGLGANQPNRYCLQRLSFWIDDGAPELHGSRLPAWL